MGTCLAGIDYGSKSAGTTVVAIKRQDRSDILLFQSQKNKDADQFIKKLINQFQPTIVGLDAPLSLPGVYRDLPGCSDYFYRWCDRALGAMSPMFLGGLTARAMKLHAELSTQLIAIYEVYPKQVAQLYSWATADYKKGKKPDDQWLNHLHNDTKWSIPALDSWHQADAVLALISANRIASKTSEKYGIEEEGIIHV